MPSSDYLKNIAGQTIIWTGAYAFWSLMRQFGHELVDKPPDFSFPELAVIYLSLGLIAGVVFATADHYLFRRYNQFLPFGQAVLLRSLIYLLIIVTIIVLGVFLFTLFDQNSFNWSMVYYYLFSGEGALLLSYNFIIIFLIHFVKEVDKKFGPGNLWRMLLGKFHKPREVERIIMFMDLRSSTTIAEKIGHIAYSNFLQDCFNELKVVLKHGAEIYQYVGDEVVLTWELPKGLRQANFVGAFVAFRNALQDKTAHFHSRYGVIPEFKCGTHVGKVVVAEIGQIKTEIAYHGDAVNTASRIQAECSVRKKNFLISDDLCELMEAENTHHTITYEDSVLLRGKVKATKIYSIDL